MIKERIEKALSKSKLTVVQAAKKSEKYKVSFTYSAVYKWMRGERTPHIDKLRTMEKITKCKKGYLTGIFLK